MWVLSHHSVCFCSVGLEDMVLSALVQEQVEGITPDAIALMTPKKMAVCFNDYVNSIYSILPSACCTTRRRAQVQIKEVTVTAAFDLATPVLRSWLGFFFAVTLQYFTWFSTKLYVFFIQNLKICLIFFIHGIHALFITK